MLISLPASACSRTKLSASSDQLEFYVRRLHHQEEDEYYRVRVPKSYFKTYHTACRALLAAALEPETKRWQLYLAESAQAQWDIEQRKERESMLRMHRQGLEIFRDPSNDHIVLVYVDEMSLVDYKSNKNLIKLADVPDKLKFSLDMHETARLVSKANQRAPEGLPVDVRRLPPGLQDLIADYSAPTLGDFEEDPEFEEPATKSEFEKALWDAFDDRAWTDLVLIFPDGTESDVVNFESVVDVTGSVVGVDVNFNQQSFSFIRSEEGSAVKFPVLQLVDMRGESQEGQHPTFGESLSYVLDHTPVQTVTMIQPLISFQFYLTANKKIPLLLLDRFYHLEQRKQDVDWALYAPEPLLADIDAWLETSVEEIFDPKQQNFPSVLESVRYDRAVDVLLWLEADQVDGISMVQGFVLIFHAIRLQLGSKFRRELW